MTAARLEELVGKCDAALAPDTPDIASILELADIADLARCARAWAKVEAELRRQGGSSVSLVLGYSGIFYSSFHFAGNSVGPTAIEAVEAAAEVKL